MVQLFTGTTLRSPPLDPAVFTLALSEPYLAQLSQRYREAANAPCSSKELTQNIIDALDEVRNHCRGIYRNYKAHTLCRRWS
jgi:hypothetical protein